MYYSEKSHGYWTNTQHGRSRVGACRRHSQTPPLISQLLLLTASVDLKVVTLWETTSSLSPCPKIYHGLETMFSTCFRPK